MLVVPVVVIGFSAIGFVAIFKVLLLVATVAGAAAVDFGAVFVNVIIFTFF